jgi:hypothetical protein
MCNFNKLNKETKEFFHLFMKKSAEAVGGVNLLLGIIEALRATKPHPLLSSKCKIESDRVVIEWDKIIFKDKFDVLEELVILHRSSDDIDFNILDEKNTKKRKKILNVIKTLLPLTFSIKAKNPNDGGGFEFKIFEKIDFEQQQAQLNPIFIAFLFCSVDFTKKALKYEI